MRVLPFLVESLRCDDFSFMRWSAALRRLAWVHNMRRIRVKAPEYNPSRVSQAALDAHY
jgi:hypothetical protein